MNILGFLKRNRRAVDDSPERRYFLITSWAFVGLFVFLGLSALIAFLLTLRGPEQTQVPDIAGEELVDALVSLQERGLYPQVQLRYHSDPTLRGRIISQNPGPGAVVRAGRRITLLVSQGAVIEEVDDYSGRLLQDVQTDLQALGVGGEGILFIDAISYVFDESPVGTIIGQDPSPGTTLSGSTGLDLIVSRGPDIERVSLPTFLGLDWSDAIQILSRDGIPFLFQLEEQPTIGQEGVVVAQEPEPGSQVAVGTPVALTIRDVRRAGEDVEFGLFDRTLPEYAVAVELSAVAVDPEGESATLFSVVHPGGRIAFPYRLPAGSTIVLYRYDVEVIRHIVRDESSEE
ncbi:MAG: PASTA domain-containing protein [Spirochaetales bacterium]|nr:PASTA domain-containing protein [Spirochaetales bacterium]